MSRSSDHPRAEHEAGAEAGLTFGEWAESRATLLVGVAILFALLAVLIVISLLHPR